MGWADSNLVKSIRRQAAALAALVAVGFVFAIGATYSRDRWASIAITILMLSLGLLAGTMSSIIDLRYRQHTKGGQKAPAALRNLEAIRRYIADEPLEKVNGR